MDISTPVPSTGTGETPWHDELRVGFVCIHRGLPLLTGTAPKRFAKIYKHAGSARCVAKNHGNKCGVFRAVIRSPHTSSAETGPPIGLVLMKDGAPVRTGKKDPVVRLFSTRGGAEHSARRHGARAHWVYLS
jgi:hypothetical protein